MGTEANWNYISQPPLQMAVVEDILREVSGQSLWKRHLLSNISPSHVCYLNRGVMSVNAASISDHKVTVETEAMPEAGRINR